MLALLLTGCSPSFHDYEDRELRLLDVACAHALELERSEQRKCDNIRRECERRQKRGRYTC